MTFGRRLVRTEYAGSMNGPTSDGPTSDGPTSADGPTSIAGRLRPATPTRTTVASRTVGLALGADMAAVLAFAAIGRSSHEERLALLGLVRDSRAVPGRPADRLGRRTGVA